MVIQKIRFLHIDDFANYRAMLRSILRSMGVEHIDDAKDAASAIEKIANNEYDVILCDYNLGTGQNGQQLLEEVMHKKLMPYGTIFIMVTAENTMDMVMAAVEYRPDTYLSKPFPKELLITRLEKLLVKKDTFKPIYKAYNNKDYQRALQICTKQMSGHPKLALDIGKLKGEIALKAGEYEMAEAIYDKALSVRDFEWAQYGKAQALFGKKDYKSAKSILNQLLEANPKYIEAYDLLASIYDLEGEFKKTQEVLEAASELSPRAVTRQQHLAQTALKNDDFDIAEKSLRASINHGKHSYLGKVSDHTELSKLYLEKGKTTKANSVLKNAKQHFKKDAEACFHTEILEGMVLLKSGKEDKAREVFSDILKKIPKDIAHMPKEIQDDLLLSSEQLGEDDLTEALKADIEGTGEASTLVGNKLEKYSFLLLNGKGMRFYKENKITDALKLFEDAANHLTDNISVNMNAAQTLIMLLMRNQVGKSEVSTYKERAREYLDICQGLDRENEKYIKLEELYKGL